MYSIGWLVSAVAAPLPAMSQCHHHVVSSKGGGYGGVHKEQTQFMKSVLVYVMIHFYSEPTKSLHARMLVCLSGPRVLLSA